MLKITINKHPIKKIRRFLKTKPINTSIKPVLKGSKINGNNLLKRYMTRICIFYYYSYKLQLK